MRSSALNTVLAVVGFAALSVVARFVLFAYFFGKPLGEINKTIVSQLKTAERAMDEAGQGDDSTRGAFKNDADWAASTFNRRFHPHHKTDDSDASSAAGQKAEIPAVPASSWLLFADTDDDGHSILHARLALSASDGLPFLTIELSQPRHAIGDAGGAAQISFASLTQASCGDADALILRFDSRPPVRFATKGVWEGDMCRFSLPNFPKFRDGLVNAVTFSVRIAKGKALTEEIPAPVGGLNWSP
jgi:hypothetical protein